MIQCSSCGLQFAEGSEALTECPNCGNPLKRQPPQWESGMAPIRKYFQMIWKILTRPSEFFRKLPLTGGIAGPLAFALATHWLSSAISFLWRSILGRAAAGYASGFWKFFSFSMLPQIDSPGRHAEWMEMRDRLVNWFWSAGAVIADPFFTLAALIFTSFVVYLGARILISPGKKGTPKEITFESVMRIMAYGLAPSVLAAIPVFGGFLATLGVFVVRVIGVREAYKVSTGRSMAVVLFPKIVLLAFFMLGLAMIAVFFVSLLKSVL